MLISILILNVALVAWSLHLMQKAFDNREFSLMLAGTLVALAAAKCKFRNNYQIQGYTTCSINEINKVQSAKSKN